MWWLADRKVLVSRSGPQPGLESLLSGVFRATQSLPLARPRKASGQARQIEPALSMAFTPWLHCGNVRVTPASVAPTSLHDVHAVAPLRQLRAPHPVEFIQALHGVTLWLRCGQGSMGDIYGVYQLSTAIVPWLHCGNPEGAGSYGSTVSPWRSRRGSVAGLSAARRGVTDKRFHCGALTVPPCSSGDCSPRRSRHGSVAVPGCRRSGGRTTTSPRRLRRGSVAVG
jgi:hypothetical protein